MLFSDTQHTASMALQMMHWPSPVAPSVDVLVAAYLLHLLGLPVPESMPGQVPESLFEPGWLAAHPVLHGPPPAGPPHDVARTDGTVEGTSPEVNERLREELRALGYIE